MLLELVDLAAVQGPVAGVVHPRREFVDAQGPALQLEQLDPDHPDIVEGIERLAGDRLGFGPGRVRQAGRSMGRAQDAALVPVLAHRIAGDLARSAPGRDHRQLAHEGDASLQDRRLCADPSEGGLGVRLVFDPGLALAVVALAASLQEGASAEPRQGAFDVPGVGDGGKVGGRHAEAAEEFLLVDPVLGDRQGALARGGQGAEGLELLDHSSRHVLEFEGDHVAGGGEGLKGLTIVVGRFQRPGGHARGGRIRLGLQDRHVEAEAGGGQGQHAAELAAAEHPDRRTGR